MNFLEQIVSYNIGTIFNYPIGLLELIGTISGMIGTILAIQRHIATWIFGIINSIAFFIIFYHEALYSDMLLQIYFFMTFIYGWIEWNQSIAKNHEIKIISLTFKQIISIFILYTIGTLILIYIVLHISIWLPTYFPKSVAYPFWDSILATTSILANLLLIYRYAENWILWIFVNCIAFLIYINKYLYLIGFEYLIFLLMAIYGTIKWTNNK